MAVILDTAIRARAGELEGLVSTRFPVVVVFERPGCAACAAIHQALEELAQDFLDLVRVVRVEDPQEAGVAARFGVTHVPTLLFRRHGREVARIEGAAGAPALRAHVEFLAGQAPRPPKAAGPRVPLAAT